MIEWLKEQIDYKIYWESLFFCILDIFRIYMEIPENI